MMLKATSNIARIAMRWTPEGKRSRGRPKTTWRRTVEKGLRELNYSWSTIEKLAELERFRCCPMCHTGMMGSK